MKFRTPKSIVAISGLIVTFLVSSIHSCTQIDESVIWGLIDEYQRNFSKTGLPPGINDVIIQDPKLLERRIVGDIDKAINEYNEKEDSKNNSIHKEPIYYQCNPDTSEAQILLGGPIGIHSPWYTPKDCKL